MMGIDGGFFFIVSFWVFFWGGYLGNDSVRSRVSPNIGSEFCKILIKVSFCIGYEVGEIVFLISFAEVSLIIVDV